MEEEQQHKEEVVSEPANQADETNPDTLSEGTTKTVPDVDEKDPTEDVSSVPETTENDPTVKTETAKEDSIVEERLETESEKLDDTAEAQPSEDAPTKREDKEETVEGGDSDKYDSAVEEMETDPTSGPMADKQPAAESLDNTDVPESGETADERQETEEQHSVRQVDETSNTSSHLHDIEMTNVDESVCGKGESMVEGDGDRTGDQTVAEDPFDRVHNSSSDDVPHADKENGEEVQDKAEVDGYEHDNNESQDQQQAAESNTDAENHKADDDVDDTADITQEMEKESEKEKEKENDDTVEDSRTQVAEEHEDETEKASDLVAEPPNEEDEANPVEDDLRGGENENICLLPDDERAISDEDNQRAIEQDEAEQSSNSVSADGADAGPETVDDVVMPEAKDCVEENDLQTAVSESIEEMEVDAPTATTEDLPARDNQIRELSSMAVSEMCLQCKRESTPCLYTIFTREDTEEEVAKQLQQYVCSFDCVQSLRTENPNKFELIQRRVSIFAIIDCQEKCMRCGETKMCKFRYRLEDGTYKYLCDSKCVEHLTAINGEKYSMVRKRYIIEERTSAQEDDKRCVQCGDTKPCHYGFKQDDDEFFLCSDCLNLFRTEHPDLFRLQRRQSVRVRNLPKDSSVTGGSGTGGENAASTDIVKFTARTEEEAEASRLEREASFLRRCQECHMPLQILSKRWLQWETMEFCDEKCLGKYQNVNSSHCVHCQKTVSVNSMGKFCVRFGFTVCQFCSATCLESYKKILKTCSYCQETISQSNKGFEFRVARVGELGVLKDFCSAVCHQNYQACLNPALKHRRHVCAVCNHEKMTKVIVHLEGRDHYFCSMPCFSAFKFVNNVSPDECAMCGDYFERKRTEAYTIYQQGEVANHDPLAFCTKMCLNLYISTNRQIVPCNWCKVKKYTFDMILRPATMVRHCSLHCLTLCEVSSNLKLTSCDHCKVLRTAQYELNMSDSSLRVFCTYQCLMKFQSTFNKSQPADDGTPVPMGIPKRIPRATTTATITTTTLPPVAAAQPARTANDGVASSPATTRTRGRAPKSSTPNSGNGNSGSQGSNLPVIASVHSLATPVGTRGSRAKTNAATLTQRNWPELRVALEPLMNLPPSGRVPLSSLITTSTGARNDTSIGPKSPVALSPALSPGGSTASSVPPVTMTRIETHTQIVTIPPTPVQVANVSTMCKPMQQTKSVSCRPIQCNVQCQTDDSLQRKIVIPIPVPIYVPVPMFMYSMPTPVPVPIPLPIPVPVFIPTTRNSASGIMKEIKKIQDKMPTDPYEAELLMMAEMVAGDKKKDESDSDSDDAAGDDHYGTGETVVTSDGMEHNASFSEDLVQMALKMASNDFTESQVDLESAMQANTITQQQQHHGYTDLQQHHHQQQLLLLEQQQRQGTPAAVVQRGRKRGTSNVGQRGGATGVNNNNTQQLSVSPAVKRIKREQQNEQSPEPVNRVVEPVEKPDANMCLKYTFGVNAWKQWVVTKNADLEKSSIRRKPFKSDILQLTADELNYSLCLFVNEVRKPNGTEYAPDTIYYLVLGIQQYLFENRRVENIFTDPYYERFTDCLDEVAKKFSMLYNDSQFIVTRVEEEHLWECKQLGAHSPHVLLSTLMFFNTKHFNLVSVEEHMELSFSHIMKHWKRTPQQGAKSTATRNVLLRFYPPQSSLAANARKKKVYEQQENEDDPLRCPVKLYEFYLSKCPESVKTRNDVFYLQPERSCVPDSPVWYSTQPLSKEALTKMLHRVKMVKEINIALLTS